MSAFAPFGLAGLAGAIGFSGGLLVCAWFFAAAAGVALLLPRTGVAMAEPVIEPRNGERRPPVLADQSSDGQVVVLPCRRDGPTLPP